jgi:hypothetical protein
MHIMLLYIHILSPSCTMLSEGSRKMLAFWIGSIVAGCTHAQVLEMLNQYTERTDGSYIEDKESAVTFMAVNSFFSVFTNFLSRKLFRVLITLS